MTLMKTIGIFTAGYRENCFNNWDADSIHAGMPGSEEAVVYMSQELARLGYHVTVFGDPPHNTRYADTNPRYVRADADSPPLDIAIAWCIADAGPRLRKRARKVFHWPHGICTSRYSDEQINAFDDTLWISRWQRSQWMGANPRMAQFTQIFGNGIVPEQFGPVEERANPYSCIYGSNYGRGLEILLRLWPHIKSHYPRATLDIYYGWGHWGALTPQSEAYIRQALVELAPLGVAEHGRVGHKELNEAYGRASLWTYPCLQVETFCITALRAQMMGALPICLQGGALNQTVRHGLSCSRIEEYPTLLFLALAQAEQISLATRQSMREFILEEYTWRHLAARWHTLFTHHLT